MTIVLAIVLIAGFTSKSSAQISVGAHAGIALPMGTFGDLFKMGFGGTANGEYALNETMSIGLNVGYYTFSAQDAFDGYKWSFIPILADFKYSFATEGFMPYVGAGIGMYMASATVKIPSYTIGGVTYGGGEATASDSKFGFFPTVGFLMGENMKFGINAKYNMVSDANYLTVGANILFPLGK